MVIAKPNLKPTVSELPIELESSISQQVGEQRFVLTGISWDGYLQILDALPKTRAVRLIYDDGTLEFRMPRKNGFINF